MTISSLMTDNPLDLSPSERKRSPSHGHICSAGAPFASLQVGMRRYEIAHALRDDDMLAFRVEGQQEWSMLDRGLDEGWVKIGADILLLDPDVLFDFLLTHAVASVSDIKNLHQMDFDTLGVRWSAVLMHDRDGEVMIGDDDWQYARLGVERQPPCPVPTTILAGGAERTKRRSQAGYNAAACDLAPRTQLLRAPYHALGKADCSGRIDQANPLTTQAAFVERRPIPSPKSRFLATKTSIW